MTKHYSIDLQEVSFDGYQAHPDEPRDNRAGLATVIPKEIESELRANRFFLKKRVWKQARKFNHYR